MASLLLQNNSKHEAWGLLCVGTQCTEGDINYGVVLTLTSSIFLNVLSSDSEDKQIDYLKSIRGCACAVCRMMQITWQQQQSTVPFRRTCLGRNRSYSKQVWFMTSIRQPSTEPAIGHVSTTNRGKWRTFFVWPLMVRHVTWPYLRVAHNQTVTSPASWLRRMPESFMRVKSHKDCTKDDRYDMAVTLSFLSFPSDKKNF